MERRQAPANHVSRPSSWARRRRGVVAFVLVAALVVVAGVVWVSLTHTRPSYDAFGWLVWGRQVLLHWNLNTDGAPSWKPLPFLFTLPYAAFGRSQMTLWTVTSSAVALAAAVFAARIAYRLTGLSSEPVARRWPAIVAGAAGGLGVIGMNDFSHQMLIATSDPMVVTLCLAAIDAHLSRRPGLAFTMLVLASLGRPEAWPFAGLYALWRLRESRSWWARAGLLAGLLLIPTGWFLIPALTSHSWFISGQLALNFPGAIHGSKLVGVTNRLLGLYELPVRLAALAAVILAAIRRDRVSLALAGAALVWAVVELAFAYHGWPASQRYLMEAGAVFVVLAAAGIGWVLDFAARGQRAGLLPGPWLRRLSPPLAIGLRGAGVAAVAIFAVALVPVARSRARLLRQQVHRASIDATRIDRLRTAVTLAGGPATVRHCGHPVTFVGFASTLAWDLDVNVSGVGYKPGREWRSHRPMVMFRPVGSGWEVTPIHTRRARVAFCQRLVLAYDVGPTGGTPSAVLTPSLPARLFEPSRPARAPVVVHRPRHVKPRARHANRPARHVGHARRRQHARQRASSSKRLKTSGGRRNRRRAAARARRPRPRAHRSPRTAPR